MAILERIKTPSDIKQLSLDELEVLAEEIRGRIIEVVKQNGGHLSSNLGAVDLTIALHYVFDFPSDKLIFDVGHQSYAHKILSGRNDLFDTIRKDGGISGFPNPSESEYDAFCSGHAGNSLSASLGYCVARDRLNQNFKVINLVGDASFFNGEYLEALSSNADKPKNLIVILNDNGMSISKNENALYKFFSKITTKKSYSEFMYAAEKTLGRTFIGKGLKRFKRFIKFNVNKTTVVEAVGLKYVGIFNGNNIKELVRILSNIKDNDKAVLLHLKTVKGKGFSEAESNSDLYHGVGKNLASGGGSFSSRVSKILSDFAKEDEKIVAVCAGMKDGVGLTDFAKDYANRFFDVGIAEEHAVTFAAGMAKGGLKPFVFIYSTFLQRSYDQIMQDVCLQNLPVIFMLDRAGVVGADGATHQGLFDLSYLSNLPNISIFAPKDAYELKLTIDKCLKLNSPCAIRYPNGINEEFESHSDFDNCIWEGDSNSDNVLLCVGPRMLRLGEEVKNLTDKNVSVVNSRQIKPLDDEFLKKISDKNIITLEENVLKGGFGESVVAFYNSEKLMNVKIKTFGFSDKFVSHATQKEQLDKEGITAKNVVNQLI